MLKTLNTVTVQVPATSANCGPGFDSVGLACNLYNKLTLSWSDTPSVTLTASGHGEGFLKPSESNFAVKAIRRVLAETGFKQQGMHIQMHNNIPLSRGLGSSSAAIVAGMTAANLLMGSPLDKEKLFELSTELEGHPDNVAPAIFGGLTVSFMDSSKPYCMKIEPPQKLQMVAVVPDFPLATKMARETLPQNIPHRDAAFNVSRVALFVASICKNDMKFMSAALQDRLHQPYRGKFIPGMRDVFCAAENSGALGCFISGSGSTLMAFVPKEVDPYLVGEKMSEVFRNFGKNAVYHVLTFDNDGVKAIQADG